MASGFGAYFGARSAQKIDNRRTDLDAIVSAHNAVGVLTILAHDIFNTYFSMKSQYLDKICKKYDSQKIKLDDYFLNGMKEENARPPQFLADYRKLENVEVNFESMEALMMRQISPSSKILSCMLMLKKSSIGLSRTIVERSELVDMHKNMKDKNHSIHMYLGRPTHMAIIDTSFPDNISALSNQCDDCLFYSKQLVDELMQLGVDMQKKNRKKFGNRIPKIPYILWDEKGLKTWMPDYSNYSEWTEKFLVERN